MNHFKCCNYQHTVEKYDISEEKLNLDKDISFTLGRNMKPKLITNLNEKYRNPNGNRKYNKREIKIITQETSKKIKGSHFINERKLNGTRKKKLNSIIPNNLSPNINLDYDRQSKSMVHKILSNSVGSNNEHKEKDLEALLYIFRKREQENSTPEKFQKNGKFPGAYFFKENKDGFEVWI